MKTSRTTIWLVWLYVACPVGRVAAEDEYLAQVSVRVLDDAQQPVTNAQVNVSTFERWVPGDHFGHDHYKMTSAFTDTNGQCRVDLAGPRSRYSFMALPPFGYYRSDALHYTFTNAVDGKWQPWNPLVEFRLRRILNPIPMYAKRVEFYGEKKVPVEGKPLGYDLMKGDWVAPFGTGSESDFIFLLQRAPEREAMSYWGNTPRPYKLYDVTLGIAFSNDGDGIQPAYAQQEGSALILLPEAPETGYQTNLVKRTFREEGEAGHSDPQGSAGYFFRVRTKRDEKGKIVSALYGKIQGDVDVDRHGQVRFTYYLNPTDNDRNIEFDPSRNLFTGLKSTERVKEP